MRAPPPSPVTTISAIETSAFARSREAISSARGALLWTDVEDALYPSGWAANPSTLLRKGAVGLSGDEHPATAALRRDAALLRGWALLFGGLHRVTIPKPAAGKFPEGVSAVELVSPYASAISVSNTSQKAFHDDLRVVEPLTRRTLVIPGVSVGPGQALWLPLSVSLGPDGLCRECTNFAATEYIVYATAELLSIEFENGILAMEFAAPEAGEVILQMARRPTGPFLAAGKPTEFDWDEPHMRARLKDPRRDPARQPRAHWYRHRSPGDIRLLQRPPPPGDRAQEHGLHHVLFRRSRRALAPAHARGLHRGANREIAQRNRLRNRRFPADAVHGDYANLASGSRRRSARAVRMFNSSGPPPSGFSPACSFTSARRPKSLRNRPSPPSIPRGGNLEISIRNNSAQIQTYHLEPAGEGLEFLPRRPDLSIGPTDERRVEFRVFPAEGTAGLRDWTLKIGSGADLAMPMRVVLVPRTRHGRMDRRPGWRRFARMDPGIRQGARRLLRAGWRTLDGIRLERHEHQLPPGNRSL